jgi:hypothetical protein
MNTIVKSSFYKKMLYFTGHQYVEVHKEAVNVITILCANADTELAINLILEGTMEILINICWNNVYESILTMCLDSLFALLKQGEILKEIGSENHFKKKFIDENGIATLNRLISNNQFKEISRLASELKQHFNLR